MSISPLPTPLQQLRGRRFSFYPPIRNVEHNEWQYRRATWTEVVVVNSRTGEEACISRAFLGEVSLVDAPVVIVGLKRELEWKLGAIAPHHRPVIEFPIAVNGGPFAQSSQAARSDPPAPVVNIRLEPPASLRKGRKIAVGLMLGSVACFIGANIARQIQMHQRAEAFRRTSVSIGPADDASAIAAKLGPPAFDRTFAAPAGRVFRTLSYPGRRFTLVLMGTAESNVRYIGALDPQGHILDFTAVPGGADTAALLRSVPTF